MNLKFSKNATKDIEVLVQIGTNQKTISYIDMIKSLLAGETLDTEYSEDISGDEKKQIEELIGKIKNIAGIPTTGSLDLFNTGQE